MGDLFPREALPNSKGNCDSWIKVATRCRCTGYDSKSDTNSKAPADLENTAEGCGIGLGGIEVEGGDSCYAGKADTRSISSLCRNMKRSLHIEEDPCSFCHTLS